MADAESSHTDKTISRSTGTDCSKSNLIMDDKSGNEQGTAAGEKSNKSEGRRKDYKSAIIIMPPNEVWPQIQAIRSIHDKGFIRWMPHVNMTFPFLPDRDEGQEFKDAARDLTEAFKVISPFRVILTKNSFSFFSHKKFSTMWLNPIPATTSSEATGTTAEAMSCGATFSEATGTTGEAASPGATDKPRHATIMKMQKVIQEVWPECDDQSTKSDVGFTPHMSLGQFPHKTLPQKLEEFQTGWQDVEFDVKEVYLISRKDFDDPFHIRETVPLGGP